MLSSKLNPQVLSHGDPGKHNEKIYVVELFLSSSMIERHLFMNKRIYCSYISHLDDCFPSFVSQYYPGISFDYYELYYNLEVYNNLLNL